MPSFVLTHHARAPRDARIGGASTIRQYLRAGLLDELHLAMQPVVMGEGEPIFHGLDLRALGYRCVRHVAGERATHVYIERQ